MGRIGTAFDRRLGVTKSEMFKLLKIFSVSAPVMLASLLEIIRGSLGLKTGAVGLKTGACGTKLNSAFADETPVGTPKLVELKAGAFGLRSEILGLKSNAPLGLNVGAEALRPLMEATEPCLEDWPLGMNDFALPGWKENAEEEKIAGLKVALGLPLGLNSFAAMLSPDIDAIDE